MSKSHIGSGNEKTLPNVVGKDVPTQIVEIAGSNIPLQQAGLSISYSSDGKTKTTQGKAPDGITTVTILEKRDQDNGYNELSVIATVPKTKQKTMNIVELLVSQNKTQSEIAGIIGKSQKTVSNYMKELSKDKDLSED